MKPDIARSQQPATDVDVCEGGSRPIPAINKPLFRAKKPNANERRRCELPSEVDEQIEGN